MSHLPDHLSTDGLHESKRHTTLIPLMYTQSALTISTHKVSSRDSEIPESLLMFSSEFPFEDYPSEGS